MTGIQSLSPHQENTSFLPNHRSPAETSALVSNHNSVVKSLKVLPIPLGVARTIIVHYHYLHSFPGGTMLIFGIFLGARLLGAATLGAGPYLAYKIVRGAKPNDCLTLTRLWLSDELPRNSESHVIGTIIRSLQKNTSLKFLVSYADPAMGHSGTIYQATNWLYTGSSCAMPLYDLGDGKARHSRSVAHAYGSHSLRYFASHGFDVKVIPQVAKYRYIYFLNKGWRSQLNVPVVTYPKKEASQ